MSSEAGTNAPGPLPEPVPEPLKVFDAADVARLLPYPVAIEALEAAFRELDAMSPQRTIVRTRAGTALVMPSSGEAGMGVKIVTLTPANPSSGQPLLHATYVLFDRVTQAPRAVIDGAALTAIRTGAVSALATSCLARPDARALVLFGAGPQAHAHLDAMRAVRPIEDVVVVSRSPAGAEALAERARDAGLRASVGDPDAVGRADIVCTCTTSPSPLFDGSLLAEGAHVNAVGAYTLHTRELDDAAVREAAIVVETREVALAEAGDIVMAFGEDTAGRIDADLHEVVLGARPRGRHSVFVSVGEAFEDLAVAAALVEAAGG